MGGRVVSPVFVGRVEELRVLEAALGRVTNSEPAVVLVGGEAGVGKTQQGINLPLKALTEAAGAFLQRSARPPGGHGRSPEWAATGSPRLRPPRPPRPLPGHPHEAERRLVDQPHTRIVGTGAVIGGFVDSGQRLKDRLNAKRKKGYTLDPDVPFVLVVGDHDPFCGDLELLLAIYGRYWEAMVGARPRLWQ